MQGSCSRGSQLFARLVQPSFANILLRYTKKSVPAIARTRLEALSDKIGSHFVYGVWPFLL